MDRLKHISRKLIVLVSIEAAVFFALVGVVGRWLPLYFFWATWNGSSISFPDRNGGFVLEWHYAREPGYCPGRISDWSLWQHHLYLGRFCRILDRPNERFSEAPVGRPDDRLREWCSGIRIPFWTPLVLAVLYPAVAAVRFARRDRPRASPSAGQVRVVRRRRRLQKGLVVVFCQLAMLILLGRVLSFLGTWQFSWSVSEHGRGELTEDGNNIVLRNLRISLHSRVPPGSWMAPRCSWWGHFVWVGPYSGASCEVWDLDLTRTGPTFLFTRFPIWTPLFLCLLYPGSVAVCCLWRRYRRRGRPSCHVCDYDLTGNKSGVCPECGREIETGRKAANH